MNVHRDHPIVPTRERIASAYRGHPPGEDDRQVNTAFGGRLVYGGEPPAALNRACRPRP